MWVLDTLRHNCCMFLLVYFFVCMLCFLLKYHCSLYTLSRGFHTFTKGYLHTYSHFLRTSCVSCVCCMSCPLIMLSWFRATVLILWHWDEWKLKSVRCKISCCGWLRKELLLDLISIGQKYYFSYLTVALCLGGQKWRPVTPALIKFNFFTPGPFLWQFGWAGD